MNFMGLWGKSQPGETLINILISYDNVTLLYVTLRKLSSSPSVFVAVYFYCGEIISVVLWCKQFHVYIMGVTHTFSLKNNRGIARDKLGECCLRGKFCWLTNKYSNTSDMSNTIMYVYTSDKLELEIHIFLRIK